MKHRKGISCSRSMVLTTCPKRRRDGTQEVMKIRRGIREVAGDVEGTDVDGFMSVPEEIAWITQLNTLEQALEFKTWLEQFEQ
ncbi:hypothetical protein [Pseudomonas fluorescens]|uniref:Uncharacterized protein n=1 Tax=Pseudomonas fluorescens TaxID=294 RepID=A0A5E6WHQ5_PSEFL|nr:hypothetical protein [Pseudomonas fluorescens]VVN28226.1 hypothetical protein PS659_04737 [Pseudomonas fluorescens]